MITILRIISLVFFFMKILHFSDTHLWIGIEWTKRDDDFYNNFNKVIESALENKVDFVVHSWDLFHFSKPSNKAISVAINWFLRLSESGIKTIIISGNHSEPRLTTTTHAFEIFKEIKNMHLIHSKWTEVLDFNWIRFVWLPHLHDEKVFKDELKTAWDFINNSKINIYTSHFWITAKEYDDYTDELSWINITKEELDALSKYDYVAMWHYHKNFNIKNIHYSWSIEHTSFNARNHKAGYNIVECKGGKVNVTKNYLPTRKMEEIIVNCDWLNQTSELIDKLEKENLSFEWAIIKVIFENITHQLLIEFNDKTINEYFKDSFYFEYRKVRKETNQSIKSKINIWENFVEKSFENFINEYNFEDKNIDKDKIKSEILELIKK